MKTFLKPRIEKNGLKKHIIHFLYGLFHLFVLSVWKIPSQSIRKCIYQLMWMKFWKNSIVWGRWEFFLPHKITIWDNSIIWAKNTLDARCYINIWNNVNFSSEVAIWTLQHDINSGNFDCIWWKVTIGDYAWISFRTTILPGVTIGEWAVIAAGSIVTKDVPPYTIVWWCPAKIIWTRSKELKYTLNSDGYIPFI